MTNKPVLSPVLISVLLLAVLGLGTWAYLHFFRDAPEPVPATGQPVRPTPPPPETEEPAPSVPALDDSDPWVRTLAEGLSSHPKLAAWLVTDDLARRFVVTVDNIAHDESPRPHLSVLDPGEGFKTKYEDGDLIIAAKSFTRYDAIAEVIASIEPQQAVEVYRQMSPLFEQAHRELGYPDGDFDKTLRQALERLLAVPIPDDPIRLEKRVTNYRFADPSLEELGPIGKHLLRLGPLNARSLQQSIRAFLEAWEEDSPAP